MNELYHLIHAQKEYLVHLRRDFHRHPELGLQEYRTAQIIEDELKRLGILHSRIGNTGVLGILKGTQQGKGVIALRADIDALPIQETNKVAYRSQTDGIMHACGHDFHTAALLGAAQVLYEYSHQFGGEVRFLFQPAEEIGRGASEFITAGALDGADRILGLHAAPDLPLYTIGIKPGLNNAAVDRFRILVTGKSSHVSTPHLGADALYAASQIVVAIQGLVTRRTSPVEPVILGIGKLQAGTVYNAVAEYAELEGTTRTISQNMRLQVREWIDRTAEHIADISGTKAQVLWDDVASAL
ncbi:MAG: amidohydrolase, partial [Lachnospiraceae bacterium]|nr:amidohydrolase [Lachnospiraceae bacterium]